MNAQPDLFQCDAVDIPPDIVTKFEQYALEVHRRGFKRYSADALLHRIRWHAHIERGDRDFKANNNWTAQLARDLMNKRPELRGFFETRERRG